MTAAMWGILFIVALIALAAVDDWLLQSEIRETADRLADVLGPDRR